MKYQWLKSVEIVIANFYNFSLEAYHIPKIIENILIIQYSLLEFSFIFSQYHNSSYIQLFIIFARPQTILKISKLEYLVICWSILFVIGPFYKYSCNKYVSLYWVLLRSALFQYVFEQLSISYFAIFVQALLIFEKLLDQCVFVSTYNVMTHNLQRTQNNFIDIIQNILDIIILLISDFGTDYLYIQLFALLNSFTKAFNISIYQHYKNFPLNTTVLCIHVITILKALINFFKVQNEIDIIIFPFIIMIINQYQQRRFNFMPTNLQEALAFYQNKQFSYFNVKGNENIIVYSSMLSHNGQMYEAYVKLKQIKKLPIIQKVKKQALQKLCVDKIFKNIITRNKKNSSYDKFLTALQNMENHFSEIEANLTSIVQLKIECLSKMLQFDIKDWYYYIDCCQKLLSMKDYLIQKYRACPTQKMQSILGFYYVQLMNDFIAAASLFQIDTYSDMQLNFFELDQSVFNGQITFIISKLDDNLTIQKCSYSISNYFPQNQSYFIEKSLDIFIPNGIKQVHQSLVNSFIQGASNRFYKSFERNIILQNDESEIFNTIEMCVDLFITDDIYSISLLQPKNQDFFVLILNSSLQIVSMSTQFIQQFDLGNSYQNLIKQNISSILPGFTMPAEQNQYYSNQELIVSFNNRKSKVSLNFDLKYLTNYSITYREIFNKVEYFIIEFEHFKKPQVTSEGDSVESLNDSIGAQTLENYLQEGNCARTPHEFLVQQINLEEFDPQGLINHNRTSENMLQIYSSPVSANQTKQQLFVTSRQASQLDVNEIENEPSSKAVENMIIHQVHYSSSQLSSIQGIHSSKYFKKYDLVHKIGENANKFHFHRHLLLFTVLFIALQIIVQSVCLTLFLDNLQTLVSDIDLLQITNYIFAPLENSIILKSQMTNYQLLFKQKLINQTYLAQLQAYPTSYLNSRFGQMKEHADLIMGKRLLQEFLENTYIDVEQQINTNMSQIYNVTLRNSLNLLIQFQFASTTQIQSALDQGIATDKTFIYFTLKNLIPIKNNFQELEYKVQISTLETQETISNQIQFLVFFEFGITSIQSIVIVFYYRKILFKQKQYFKLFLLNSKNNINIEIQKLSSILQGIQKNTEFLYQFQFSLDSQDKKIDSKIKLYKSERRRDIKISAIKMLSFVWIIKCSIIMLLIFLNNLLSYSLLNQYLQFYPPTIELYRNISVLGVDLPSLYSRRENYQYRSIYPYFDSDDEKAMINDILIIMDRIQSFSQLEINLDQILVSNTFREKFTLIMESNLCNELPKSIINNSITLCPKTLNGQLVRGVATILISIINQFKNDYQINQFKAKLQSPILEIEGIFMMNEILVNVNEEFKSEFLQVTNDLADNLFIQNIVLLIFQSLLTLITCRYIIVELKRRNELIQSLPYLLPENVLLIDDGFELQLKQLFQDFL